jgi:hypothetical protein
MAGGRAVENCRTAFVGIDVAKARNAMAVAEGGRGGEVRCFGEVEAAPDNMRRIVRRIASKQDRVEFCCEAGLTGYGLHDLPLNIHPATTRAAAGFTLSGAGGALAFQAVRKLGGLHFER